jgi:hypothetical protein
VTETSNVSPQDHKYNVYLQVSFLEMIAIIINLQTSLYFVGHNEEELETVERCSCVIIQQWDMELPTISTT